MSRVTKQLLDSKVIGQDEKLLFETRQIRFRNMIHPMSLIITDKQIIIYAPKWTGHDVKSYGFRADRRLMDITVDSGFRRSSLIIRGMTDIIRFSDIRRNVASQALRAIRLAAE